MEEGLVLTHGGRLLENIWVYDDEKDEGSYVTRDVTDKAPLYLFEPCILEEGVLLKDVFQLLERHLDLYKKVIGNWVGDIVAEGFQTPERKAADLTHLELYWSIDYDEKRPAFTDNLFPAFHGIGVPGETAYSLMFTPSNEIAHLPLKLSDVLTVSMDSGGPEVRVVEYKGPQYSLGHILYGIIWELTWCGGPEEREQAKRELLETRNSESR